MAACGILLLGATGANAACSADELAVRGPFGKVQFNIEIADTDETRARGLMFRESMPRFAGMLFFYDRPQRVSFWMKNTLIALDMLFVDESGTVQRLHHNAIPGDLTSINGGSGILAVLEINGGLSARLGITVGSELQHPGFEQEKAAYPCD